MKKILSLFIVAVMFLSLTACSSSSDGELPPVAGDPSKVEGAEYVEKEPDKNDTAAEVGEEEVYIYIPSDFILSTVQSISDDAKEKGAKDVKVYSDGSVSYTMGRSDYDKMMEENKTAFEKNIKDIMQQDHVYNNITYNDDFSEFKFYVDGEAYKNRSVDLVKDQLYAGSKMYQIYMCKDPESIKFSYEVIDKDTNEVVETGVFPDDLTY